MAAQCPICKRPVTGDRGNGFFCKSCNMLFKAREVLHKPSKLRKRLIDHHFGVRK